MQNETQHIARLRAEGHANANFAGALFDCVSDRAVNPNAREQERDSGKNPEQPHHQPRLAERLGDYSRPSIAERNRQAGIDFGQRRLHQAWSPRPLLNCSAPSM